MWDGNNFAFGRIELHLLKIFVQYRKVLTPESEGSKIKIVDKHEPQVDEGR